MKWEPWVLLGLSWSLSACGGASGIKNQIRDDLGKIVLSGNCESSCEQTCAQLKSYLEEKLK